MLHTRTQKTTPWSCIPNLTTLSLFAKPMISTNKLDIMGKWEFSMDPVQEWGEEEKDGAIFGITLRRDPVCVSSPDSPDQPTVFSFSQYHTVKLRRIKAASLDRLVSHLLDHENQEPDFARVFLSTYRAFTSTTALIELLFQRDESVASSDNTVCPRRYHTGSLAFGSLILSIVQIIRVILEYLDHKLKGAQNKCAKFMLSCMKCCFWCLEKCIKFLNRNAYIMIAIYGKSFCTSAKDAFFLLMRNIVRVAVLDKVTDFLLFLGKLLIVGIVGIFSFFFFSGRIKAVEEAAPSLNYYWVPILTVVVGSYLIAHGFFSVYAMCVDTLFLCFCEDLERNDGSSDRPYFMSPELHDILSKTKRPEEESDGVEQLESAKNMDEVKCEEETPLQQQQDGEIQLKQQPVLKQDNEEEQPLQANAENATEENKVVQNDIQATEIEQKPEIKEPEEKQEVKDEEKTEEAPAPKDEVKAEEIVVKKEEEPKQETVSSPQE